MLGKWSFDRSITSRGQKGHLKKCWCALPLPDVSMGIAGWGFKNTIKTPRYKLPATAAPNKLVSKRQQKTPRWKRGSNSKR